MSHFNFSAKARKEPVKTKSVTATVPVELKEEFQAACDEAGVRMSAVLKQGKEFALSGDEEFLGRLEVAKDVSETATVSLTGLSADEHAALKEVAESCCVPVGKIVEETIKAFLEECDAEDEDKDE
ncbi:hypothetical protein [Rhodobacteraceae phage LS06-2018-MD06]|jgi:hypothetical protein|nr:hypothetical protein [Rhodobacteraceae phage LS06-2018-MD06]